MQCLVLCPVVALHWKTDAICRPILQAAAKKASRFSIVNVVAGAMCCSVRSENRVRIPVESRMARPRTRFPMRMACCSKSVTCGARWQVRLRPVRWPDEKNLQIDDRAVLENFGQLAARYARHRGPGPSPRAREAQGRDAASRPFQGPSPCTPGMVPSWPPARRHASCAPAHAGMVAVQCEHGGRQEDALRLRGMVPGSLSHQDVLLADAGTVPRSRLRRRCTAERNDLCTSPERLRSVLPHSLYVTYRST
jgi:hypothetical protein